MKEVSFFPSKLRKKRVGSNQEQSFPIVIFTTFFLNLIVWSEIQEDIQLSLISGCFKTILSKFSLQFDAWSAGLSAITRKISQHSFYILKVTTQKHYYWSFLQTLEALPKYSVSYLVSSLGLLPSTLLDMLWFCFLEGSPALGFWLPQYLFWSEVLPLLILFYSFFLVLCCGLLLSLSAARHSFYKGIAWLVSFGSFACIPVKTDWDFQWVWVMP